MNFDIKVSQKLLWGQYFLKYSQKCIRQRPVVIVFFFHQFVFFFQIFLIDMLVFSSDSHEHTDLWTNFFNSVIHKPLDPDLKVILGYDFRNDLKTLASTSPVFSDLKGKLK